MSAVDLTMSHGFAMFYLGAFGAFGISPGSEIAAMLAGLTRGAEDAVLAVNAMRLAPPLHRVERALATLEARRSATASTEPPPPVKS